MFAEVFPGTVQPGFHGRDTGGQNFGDFCVAPAFLDQREQRAILRAELGERMPEGIKFLGVDGSRRLGDVFMLDPERQKNPAEFLAAELINAGVAGEAKEPRLKLCRCLEVNECTDHLDEHLLGKIFDIIAPAGHRIHKASHPVLVADNKLPLGVFFAFLGSADEVHQGRR